MNANNPTDGNVLFVILLNDVIGVYKDTTEIATTVLNKLGEIDSTLAANREAFIDNVEFFVKTQILGLERRIQINVVMIKEKTRKYITDDALPVIYVNSAQTRFIASNTNIPNSEAATHIAKVLNELYFKPEFGLDLNTTIFFGCNRITGEVMLQLQDPAAGQYIFDNLKRMQ